MRRGGRQDREDNVEQEAASSNSALSASGKVRVLKFGGSSLRDADRIHAVAGLVTRALSETIPVVVVSAVGGTTNALVEIAERAGFSHVEYLSVVFKKKIGVPPSQYRARNRR
jgi:AraC-like DNA-binding protein